MEYALREVLVSAIPTSPSLSGSQTAVRTPEFPASASITRAGLKPQQTESKVAKPRKASPTKEDRAKQKLAAKLKAVETAKRKRQRRAKESLERWRAQALKNTRHGSLSPAQEKRIQNKRQNDAARLAFNQKIRNKKETLSTGSKQSIWEQSFEDLKAGWARAILYLHRFGDNDPTAPDITAFRARIEEIEAEWERRAGLARGDPGYFDWPITDAPGGSRDLNGDGWEDTGMLRYLGYRVGRGSELSKRQRELLLSHIFSMQLPPLNNATYMREWSLTNSPQRLRKMAECIAAFARNAKRRKTQNFAEAVRHWEEDLSFLRRKYYVGKFRFAFEWPSVSRAPSACRRMGRG